MEKTLSAAVLMLLSLAPFASSAHTESDQSQPFAVGVKVASVASNKISVKFKVINKAVQTKKFWVWNCSYAEHWLTDNKVVSVEQQSCAENSLEEISLHPGKLYSGSLELTVGQIPEPRIEFKLGFSPTDKPSGGAPIPTSWSRSIKVKIHD